MDLMQWLRYGPLPQGKARLIVKLEQESLGGRGDAKLGPPATRMSPEHRKALSEAHKRRQLKLQEQRIAQKKALRA